MTSAALSLEALLTLPVGFDLGTASPLQRAITRAADGQPVGDALEDDAIKRHFGCARDAFDAGPPSLVVLVCGVRSGKSLLAAAASVKAALTANLDALKHHEVARVSIVGPTSDNASATFRLLVGSVQSSSTLASLVVGEPTSDTLTLRRPDGRAVEIVVVAASRGAITLRSRWSAGFVLDELALFGVESSGAVVNAEELLRAGETRLVPGAQGWLISSPYGPEGLLFELHRDHFGKPDRVLVVHAPTRAMNPTFPEAQVEAIRARTPDVAAREYDAQWLDADSAFFDSALIDRAVRAGPLERPAEGAREYVATMDAATRGNSWTLVVGRADSPGVVISLARQWTGSKTSPLDPAQVFKEIAAALRPYRVHEIHCDAWALDPLRSCASAARLELRPQTLGPELRVQIYRSVETLLRTAQLELTPNDVLVRDLRAVRKRALAGGVRVDLPRTADGRHADYAPSVAMLCHLIGPAAQQTTGAGWLEYMRSLASGETNEQIANSFRPAPVVEAFEPEDFITLVAPPSHRCVTLNGLKLVYHVGPDGLVRAHPEDVKQLRLYRFTDAP